ncbi:MAG TPA: hypothetical protein VGH38_02535, partial [Bryobacteraceae bacterium]
MRRGILLTAALAGLVMVAAYGFWSRHLWQQGIWDPPGGQRFLIFLAAASGWFGAWIRFRPALMVPCTIGLTAIYTVNAVGILPLAAVVFFLFGCLVLGRLILPQSEPFRGAVPDLLAMLAGLCVLMWLGNLLAHFPVNYPAVYLAILAAVVLVRPATTALCLRRAAGLFRPVEFEARTSYVLVAVALVPLLAHWLVVLKPEVSADALSMHLVVPAYVANHHLWSFDFRHFTWAVMPMGAVWGYTVTYLLGGEFAARLLNFALLAVLCALIYQGARRWVERPAAFLMAGLFASTPVVQLVTGSIFVESFYAVLLMGAVFAVWHHHDTGDRPSLVLAAFFLASSLEVKLMALPFAVPIGLVLCGQLVKLWRSGEKRWLLSSAAVILALSPLPYVYSWVKTGNPVFPYVNSIFRSPYFAPVMSPDPRFLEPLTWKTPFHLTFETHRYWEGQDGSAGFHLFLLLPLVLLMLRRDWRFAEWTLVGIAVGGTLFGLLLRPNVRYLYPAFPLLTLSLALLFRDPKGFGRIAWGPALACFGLNLWFLPSSSFYHKTFCLNPFDRTAVERYLEEAAPVRHLIAELNRKYPGENALFLETMDVAGLKGEAWSNGWHSYFFVNRMMALDTDAERLRLANELGLRHFVYPNPASGVEVGEWEFREFLYRFTAPEEDWGRFRLARLRPEFTGLDAVPPAAEDRPHDPATPGRYDDYDVRMSYLHHWHHDRQFAAAAHHSLSYSDVAGASVRFRFRGSEIAWVYTKGVNRGVAEVSV